MASGSMCRTKQVGHMAAPTSVAEALKKPLPMGGRLSIVADPRVQWDNGAVFDLGLAGLELPLTQLASSRLELQPRGTG